MSVVAGLRITGAEENRIAGSEHRPAGPSSGQALMPARCSVGNGPANEAAQLSSEVFADFRESKLPRMCLDAEPLQGYAPATLVTAASTPCTTLASQPAGLAGFFVHQRRAAARTSSSTPAATAGWPGAGASSKAGAI